MKPLLLALLLLTTPAFGETIGIKTIIEADSPSGEKSSFKATCEEVTK